MIQNHQEVRVTFWRRTPKAVCVGAADSFIAEVVNDYVLLQISDLCELALQRV